MTQNEIIEMARQAGIKRRTDEFYSEFCDGVYFDDLEAFAKLVAAKAETKEREACAKLIDELPAPDEYSNTDKSMWDVTCIDCAEAIRARKQA
jgi:hypothetical protein